MTQTCLKKIKNNTHLQFSKIQMRKGGNLHSNKIIKVVDYCSLALERRCLLF